MPNDDRDTSVADNSASEYVPHFNALERWLLSQVNNLTACGHSTASGFLFHALTTARALYGLLVDMPRLLHDRRFDEIFACGVVMAHQRGEAPETHMRHVASALGVPVGSVWHESATVNAHKITAAL
jgi:hypothetical protein